MSIGAVGLAGSDEDENELVSRYLSALKVDETLLREAGDGEAADVVKNLREDVESRATLPVKVSIFLRSDVSESALETVRMQLEEHPGVDSFEYVSAEQAYDEFVKEYEDQPEFFENLPQDALPASFRVETTEGTDPEAFAQELSGLPGVDDVRTEGQLSGVVDSARAALQLCGMNFPVGASDR